MRSTSGRRGHSSPARSPPSGAPRRCCSPPAPVITSTRPLDAGKHRRRRARRRIGCARDPRPRPSRGDRDVESPPGAGHGPSARRCGSLHGAARATNGHRPAAAARAHEEAVDAHPRRRPAPRRQRCMPTQSHPTPSRPPPRRARSTPGSGFDACSAPSDRPRCPRGRSRRFTCRRRSIIGGANMACSQSNLTASLGRGGSPRPGLAHDPDLRRPAGADQRLRLRDDLHRPTQPPPRRAPPPRRTRSPRRRRSGSAPATRSISTWRTTRARRPRPAPCSRSWRRGRRELHDSGYDSGIYSSALSGITDLVASGRGRISSSPTTSGWPTGTASRRPPTAMSPPNEWAGEQRPAPVRGRSHRQLRRDVDQHRRRLSRGRHRGRRGGQLDGDHDRRATRRRSAVAPQVSGADPAHAVMGQPRPVIRSPTRSSPAARRPR